MYDVNVSKVRGKMAEKTFTITSLADVLGVDRNTLSKYLASPKKIPYEVLSKMADVLCDTESEAQSIFFAKELTRNVSLEEA